MDDQPVYVVTDGEYDGPSPGQNSMMSFASVAVSTSGDIVGEFEAVLHPLEGATQSADTMEFWSTVPEAYAAATQDPQAPEEVLKRFVGWVRSLPGAPVFVSHPVGLDGAWMDYYLRKFTEECLLEGPWKTGRLFKGYPLCLTSFIAGKLGRSPLEWGGYPKEWLGHVDHTHRAIDDARGYAHLLIYVSKLPPQGVCEQDAV